MAVASRHVFRRMNTWLLPNCIVKRHLANQKSLATASTVANEKINRLLQAYEDIVGLSEVRDAQENVIKVGSRQLPVFVIAVGLPVVAILRNSSSVCSGHES